MGVGLSGGHGAAGVAVSGSMDVLSGLQEAQSAALGWVMPPFHGWGGGEAETG